jgi:hypothetical protein
MQILSGHSLSQNPFTISVYRLMTIINRQLGLDLNLYTILQILGVTLFEKVAILHMLMEAGSKTDHANSCNQLMLYDLQLDSSVIQFKCNCPGDFP